MLVDNLPTLAKVRLGRGRGTVFINLGGENFIVGAAVLTMAPALRGPHDKGSPAKDKDALALPNLCLARGMSGDH